jgi:hypothetical protein
VCTRPDIDLLVKDVKVGDLDPEDELFCEKLFEFTDASRFEN